MSQAAEIGAKYFPCTCDEIYTSRNMVAPDCEFHLSCWQEALKEAMSVAFDEGFMSSGQGFNGEHSPDDGDATQTDAYRAIKMKFLNEQLPDLV